MRFSYWVGRISEYEEYLRRRFDSWFLSFFFPNSRADYVGFVFSWLVPVTALAFVTVSTFFACDNGHFFWCFV